MTHELVHLARSQNLEDFESAWTQAVGAPDAELVPHYADALDWLGAVGVARVMALTEAQGGKPGSDDMVKLLEANLAKVPDRVLSPAGKALVPGRKAELETFLRALKAETDDLTTL